MWRVGSLGVCVVVGLALAAPASPDRSGVDPARPRLDAPDGLLVLAVLAPERAMVADPRTGATSARRLAGGTLCHGPLLAVGDRVILSGLRGRRVIALSLPLTLKGRLRPLGAADAEAVRRFRERTRTSFHGGWLIAARGTRFARCRGHCRRLELRSRDGGRVLDPPEGLRPHSGGGGDFSPDGRRLALPVHTRRGTRVGVIDLAGDTWTVLPGSRLPDYRSVAWSPSGRWLYFTGASHRLSAWRLGSARPIRLPIRPGGTVMSIATANAPR